MSFGSGRSTGPRRRSPPPAGVDVYLLPAVVGGGLGDIEEVLAAGRRLARAGFPIVLYRRPGVVLPRDVDGPWDWPSHRRVRALHPRHRRAMTIAPAWGVSAAPARPGAFGRPGPWAAEAEEIERTYGSEHVLHVSLEEFARTFDAAAETRERLREGGVPAREMAARRRAAERHGEVGEFRRAYARFRAFDRPNVLPLFATFRPSHSFREEYPDAVQTGPLWPNRYRPAGRRGTSRQRTWVWYASPASAERIAPRVLAGLAGLRPAIRLFVRSPRAWPSVPPSPDLTVQVRPMSPAAWERRFAHADLRIVTGSRTLLEALEVGGPFLYFNGVLGPGRRRRRHRPEKIDALLEIGRRAGVPPSLVRDLANFARGRDIEGVVRRTARRRGGWERWRAAALRREFPPPFDDAAEVLVTAARSLAGTGSDATKIVAELRRRAKS